MMLFDQLLADSEPVCFPTVKDVRRYRNLMIPVRDGISLAADVFLPDKGDEKTCFPVVMEYIPYRKDQLDMTARPFYAYLPQHGYIVVRVDIRGTGASPGISRDEYLQKEQEDGYDCVEWIAGQKWCSGHVNMIGISYGGFTSLQVAVHQPPHLTSIIPVDFTDDRYHDDCHYQGGLLRMYYDVAYYGGAMVASNAMPPLMETAGGEWADIWQQHLNENEPYLLEWYRHQTDGPYWRHGSVRYTADSIRCPVFMIGGWRDGYMNVPLRLFESLSVPRKVWIGPWNHAMPDSAVPGPRVDYLKEVVRWLDYWCKGKETGIMNEPQVVVYMQQSEPPKVDRMETLGEWRGETTWPPSGSDRKHLFLANNGGLIDELQGEGSDQLTYIATVGSTGGLFSGGIQFGLPGDQRADEAFSRVYTTSPLDENLSILGRPKVLLYISSSARVMGFAVSLSDISPDGSSHLVAKGMLNATRRDSFTAPKPLEPGEIYELNIEIDTTGWVFKKGHCIRLSVANANWPNFWPTPEPGTSQIFWGMSNPSKLILPVVPESGTVVAPVFSPSDLDRHPHLSALVPPVWEVCHDMLSGKKTMTLNVNHTQRLSETTVFEKSAQGEFQVNPSHPELASAVGNHLQRLKSPGGEIASESHVWIQGGKTHFQIIIHLKVSMNNNIIFNKQWIESIERCLL